MTKNTCGDCYEEIRYGYHNCTKTPDLRRICNLLEEISSKLDKVIGNSNESL